MPRTVESILACHHDAVALKRAGKPIWSVTLGLEPIWDPYCALADEMTGEQGVELAHKIASVLKVKVPAAWREVDHANYSMDFEDLFDRFEQATVFDFTPTEDFPETPYEVIAGWVDELYDWGDRFRVWVN